MLKNDKKTFKTVPQYLIKKLTSPNYAKIANLPGAVAALDPSILQEKNEKHGTKAKDTKAKGRNA